MPGNDYRNAIIQKYPNENPEDIIFMIETIARRRAERLNIELTNDVYDFAGTIICVILDPVKNDAYQKDMTQVRREYRGISQSSAVAADFTEALTDELLTATTIEEAIRGGAFHLIRVVVTQEMGA